MSDTIPGKIVRKIIFDILIERSNSIDEDCDEKIERDIAEIGYTTESTGELGWTACGTRVLADDVLEGIIPLEEAVDILTPYERRKAKTRCKNWLDEKEINGR